MPEQSTGVTVRDPLDTLELATAVLVRNFEMLRRRSDIYQELDRAEYLLLRVLDESGPVDIGTLAAAVGLDPSTAGRQVAAMRGKGLAECAPSDADRRRNIVSPTDEGRRRMAATRARRRETTATLLSDWTNEDVDTLARLLIRYNGSVAERYLTEPAKV